MTEIVKKYRIFPLGQTFACYPKDSCHVTTKLI